MNSIRWRSFSVRWSSLLESIKRNGFRPIWPRICIIHHSLSATCYYIYTNISSGLRIRTKTHGQSPDKLSRRLGECTFDRYYLSWDFVRWCLWLKLYVSKESCAIISYRLVFGRLSIKFFMSHNFAIGRFYAYNKFTVLLLYLTGYVTDIKSVIFYDYSTTLEIFSLHLYMKRQVLIEKRELNCLYSFHSNNFTTTEKSRK